MPLRNSSKMNLNNETQTWSNRFESAYHDSVDQKQSTLSIAVNIFNHHNSRYHLHHPHHPNLILYQIPPPLCASSIHTYTVSLPNPEILAVAPHSRVPTQELGECDTILTLNRPTRATCLHHRPLVAILSNPALDWSRRSSVRGLRRGRYDGAGVGWSTAGWRFRRRDTVCLANEEI